MIAPVAASHTIVWHVTPASDPPQSLADPPQIPVEPPQSPPDPPQTLAEDMGGALAKLLQQYELQLQHLQPLSAWAFQQHLPQQLQGQGFGQASVLAQGRRKLAFVSQLTVMLMLTQQQLLLTVLEQVACAVAVERAKQESGRPACGHLPADLP